MASVTRTARSAGHCIMILRPGPHFCLAEMPARATIFRWLARNEKFRRSYTIARQCQIEDLMDEMLEIVDDSSRDYVEKTAAIKARRWMLAHLMPKKYRHW